jgi:hypothetical protein
MSHVSYAAYCLISSIDLEVECGKKRKRWNEYEGTAKVETAKRQERFTAAERKGKGRGRDKCERRTAVR